MSQQHRMIINTRERAVSTDINRAQSFLARLGGELARVQLGGFFGDFYNNPGWFFPETTVTTNSRAGLRGMVLRGLELLVDEDPTSLHVNPGVVALYNEANPNYVPSDDSPMVVVIDPGLSSAGTLPFTSNAGGVYTRVDIIEVQPADAILETSNRDVYDPVSGLFAPQALDKVRTPRLTYRYRLGTPGVQGTYDPAWMPIAIAVVNTAATSFQNVDFYDVRPLWNGLPRDAGDGESNGFTGSQSYPGATFAVGLPNLEEATFVGLSNSAGGTDDAQGVVNVSGWFKGTYQGKQFGGVLEKNTPTPATGGSVFGSTAITGGDYTNLNPRSAEEWLEGAMPTSKAAGTPVHLICFFPGLATPNVGGPYFPFPRFVRYTQTQRVRVGAALRRAPHGPNGLVVFAHGDNITTNGLAVNAAQLKCGGLAGPGGNYAFGYAYGILLATTTVAAGASAGRLTPFARNQGGLSTWDVSYPQTLNGWKSLASIPTTVIALSPNPTVSESFLLKLGSLPVWAARAKRLRILVGAGMFHYNGAGTPVGQDGMGCNIELWGAVGTANLTEISGQRGMKLLFAERSHKPTYSVNVSGTGYGAPYEKFVFDIDLPGVGIHPNQIGVATWWDFWLHISMNDGSNPLAWWVAPSGPGSPPQAWAAIIGIQF